MLPAVYDRTTVDIEATKAIFRATGQVVKFDGFMRVYTEGQDEPSEDDAEARLPALNEGELLKLLGFAPEQHFTQPPPRFSARPRSSKRWRKRASDGPRLTPPS